MLQRFNKQLEKMMPLITPVSVILGVLLASYLKNFSYLITWIFAFMTFAGSLGSNFHSFKEVVKHPVPIIAAFCVLHILMPVWALAIGHLTFNGDPYTITGLVMAMVIPTGITSFIWVSIYKGNIPMTLAIILIDTLLSPFVVPFSLALIVGKSVHMDVVGIMKGMLGMVVAPSLLGMILNNITKGKINECLGKRLSPISKLCVGITVMLNGAVVAPYLRQVSFKLVGIALVVFLIALSGYWFSFLCGRLLKKDRNTTVSLIFSGGMRNISAGAVLATTYFPAAVAVPVVLGMLFQQVLASTNGYILDKHFQSKTEEQRISA